jgi:RimJ/RimL family protein N-acetyltransferase
MTESASAPVLRTERLTMRPFRAGDADAQAAMMGDPEVMRHLGGLGLSREDSWRKLLGGHAMWSLLGFGYWAVERSDSGAMIGQVGFADFQRDTIPSIAGLPEMGWLFALDAAGQGFATEAAAAGLAWIDEALSPPETVAIIDTANAASIRVAQKCGFDAPEPALYRGESILLFRRRRARVQEAF